MVLPGIIRKVSTAFILLSLVGWITFGVGFGFRNFEYSKRDNFSRATLYPGFTGQWVFGLSAPILFVLTVLDLFCASRITKFLTYLILPIYLAGAGCVLFLDGHSIQQYHRLEAFKDEHNVTSLKDLSGSRSVSFSDTKLRLVVADASLVSDFSLLRLDQLNIHGDDNYVAIEFAGVIVGVLFYWVYMILTPFFTQKVFSDLED